MDQARIRQLASRSSVLMKALSNEYRVAILCQLSEGEKSVRELIDLVGLNPSPLSQHLALLRRTGLVQARRQSQTIHYSLKDDHATKVIELLLTLYCDASINS